MPIPTIHFVHFRSTPGGIESLTPKIIRSLNDLEFRVFIVRPPDTNQINVYDDENVVVTYGSKYITLSFLHLFVYALKNRNDIFHVFNLGPLLLLAIRMASIKKVIYSIHGTIYWKKKYQKIIRRFLWKIAISPHFIFLANSYYSRKCFLDYNYFFKGQIQVVYNPIASERFSQKSRSFNDNLQIIYCGRLVQGKNLFTWLDAACEIHKTFPQSVFKIYGNGPQKDELIEYSKQIGLFSVVHFVGYIKDIQKAYQEADLMLFLSEYESFGNVVVESILCGTPVLVSRIPSMMEIFHEYPEFIVAEDHLMIQDILNKISNIGHLKKLAQTAEESFRQKYSLDQHVKKLESIYIKFK
ncbi:MAG: glycosyltransferase family 4 protein [Salinivirgaceae bacterium]|jgi:glycosyltransferase involved in cell wall biosynthesis|nr:glycosyltransferase family 4 protein [Salinivirgaceae bacterium]